MGPRVVSKTLHFDFNRDPLYGDERMKFCLIKDTTACKGLNVFKTILNLFCKADIDVTLLCSDGPVEDIAFGLNLNKEKTFILDGFADSEVWNRKSTFFDSCLEKIADLKGILCIYSLTSILIQDSVEKIYRSFHKILTNNKQLYILALLHSDVHSLREIEMLDNLATSILSLDPEPGSNKFFLSMATKNKGFSQLTYDYHLSKFMFESVKIAPQKSNKMPTKKPDPTANLTFNLNLNEDEKEARSKLQMPFTKLQAANNVTTEDLENDYFDEEDPDDDLDFLEAI